MSAPVPTASLTRARVVSWRNALFVVFALCGVGLGSWAARIPAVSDLLSLDPGGVGLLLFGIALGSIVGLLAAGHLVATFGTKAVMRVTLLIGPLALASGAFATAVLHSFPLAFAGLAVFGMTMSTCDVSMNVSGAANERALGRTIMPIYHAFFSFGTMAGAGLGALAEGLDIPLQLHFLALAIAMVIAAMVSVGFLLPESIVEDSAARDRAAAAGHGVAPEAPEPTTWRERLGIWRDPRTIMIGLLVLGMAFAEGSANDWLSYAMVQGHGTDETTGAVVFGIFVTAMTIGRLAGVKVLDRFGRVPVLMVTSALAAVGLILVIAVPVLWVSYLGVVLWGLGASLGFPVGMSAAADDPRTAAARVSAVATIGYCSFLIGPPAIGFLGDRFGILNALLVVLVLVAVAGFASRSAREPEHAEAHAEVA